MTETEEIIIGFFQELDKRIGEAPDDLYAARLARVRPRLAEIAAADPEQFVSVLTRQLDELLPGWRERD